MRQRSRFQVSTADPRAAIWGRLFFFRCLLFLRGAVCMFQQPFAVGPAIQPQAFGDNRPVFHAHTETCRDLRAFAVAAPAQVFVNEYGIVFRQIEAGQRDINAHFRAGGVSVGIFQAKALSCGSRLRRVMCARPSGSAPSTA